MTLTGEAQTKSPDIVRINPADGKSVLGIVKESGVDGVASDLLRENTLPG